MARYIALAGLVALVSSVGAADAPGVEQWTSAQLKGYEQSLAPRLSAQKVASQTVARYGNHSLLVAHREGSGQGEYHLTQADLIIVQTGEASILIGGELVDGRTTSQTEMIGSAVRGGTERTLGPGDVLHIPAKTPHQMIIQPGRQITYVTVKIDTPQ
jgi:hypothetical protein